MKEKGIVVYDLQNINPLQRDDLMMVKINLVDLNKGLRDFVAQGRKLSFLRAFEHWRVSLSKALHSVLLYTAVWYTSLPTLPFFPGVCRCSFILR